MFGRSDEIARAQAAVDAALAGNGAGTSVLGPPGIGKSSFLRALTESRPGVASLQVRARPGIDIVPYVALRELLEPMSDQITSRNGVLALLLDEMPGDVRGERGPTDSWAARVELLEFVTELAAREPLLLVLDDVQWLDPASVAALAFVAQRVEGDAVGFVVAHRDDATVEVLPQGSVEVVLEGLPYAPARALIGDRMAPTVAETVIRATGGNPLAILNACELLSPSERDGSTPLAAPLPLPESLEAAFVERADRVSKDVRLALLVVACEERLARDQVLSACTALGLADGSLDEAERAGLICDRGSGIELDHPLLAAAIYQGASAASRRDAHRAVAGTLRRAADQDRRAWHLARAASGRDENVASLLERSGERAMDGGDAAAAAASFERAAELSAVPERRAARAARAGDAYAAAGMGREALQVYDLALTDTCEVTARIDMLVRRCSTAVMSNDPEDEARQLQHEIDDVRGVDPQLAATLAVYASLPASASGRLPLVETFITQARELCPQLDPVAELIASGIEAAVWAYHGDCERALPAFRHIVESPGAEELHAYTPYIANLLAFCDDIETATRVADAVIELFRSRRMPGALAYPLVARAEIGLRVGEFMDVRADASEAEELSSRAGMLTNAAYALCSRARAEAVLGNIDEGRRCAQRALDLARRENFGFIEFWGEAATGFVELSASAPGDAIPHLERAGTFASDQQIRLAAAVPWGPDLVEAYVRTGDRSRAEQTLQRLEAEAGDQPTAWTRAVLGRCAGLVATSSDLDEPFKRSLEAHERSSTPFDLARTELCYGERLQAARRPEEACRHLDDARRLFKRLHAASWAERAEEAMGKRGRSQEVDQLATLSPREYEVARAVAGGATNAEAAAALFVSRRTIEHHLMSIYRKVGVRSRTQLANRMQPDPPT